MDSKQAIELLEKHDTISHLGQKYGTEIYHNLGRKNAVEIAALIGRQERMVKNAIDYIQDQNGDCPLNAGCNCVEDDMCTGPCPLDGSDEQAEKCWRRWLEQGAQ